MTDEMPLDGGESKAAKRVPRKFWFAVCSEMFEHEIVGADVKSPKAADTTRQVWSPFVVWQWLIKEAARQDRQRIIKGKIIPLRRGQVAISLRYLARKANWNLKAARGFLERLEAREMVVLSRGVITENEGTARAEAGKKKGTPITVLTVCNYDVYQNAPKHKGTAGAQQGHSQGHKTLHRYRGYIEDHHQSDPDLEDDDRRKKPLRISPSIVQALTNHVGAERSGELVSEYLASSYARNAKVLDKAFMGWLRKAYGVVISGAGAAAPSMADIIAMCGPSTELPTAQQLRARRRA